MARIINFYIPQSYRRISRPSGFVGLAKVIPFPTPARQEYSGSTAPSTRERLGVRKILRNNGILGLIAGV